MLVARIVIVSQSKGEPYVLLFLCQRNEDADSIGIEFDEAADGALTHGAELGHLVGAHAAVLHGAVHALAQVAAALK